MGNTKRGYFILAFALAVPLLAAACGGGDDEQLTEVSDQIQTVQQQVSEVGDQIQTLQHQLQGITGELEGMESAARVSQVIGTIRHIDAAGFQGIDSGLQAGELNPRWAGTVGNVIAVTKATAWPADLEELATAFLQTAEDLEQALAAEDVAAAGAPATAAHGTQHGLSHATFAWLSGEEHGGDEHQDGGGSGGHTGGDD